MTVSIILYNRFFPEFRFLYCSKGHFENHLNLGRSIFNMGGGVYVNLYWYDISELSI